MTRIPSSKTGESRVQIRDEGMLLSELAKLNFVGDGVTASVAGDTATITIPGSGDSYVWPGFEVFNDAAASQGFADSLKLTGAGVTFDLTDGLLTLDIEGGGDSGSTTPPTDTNYETMFNPKSTAYGALGDGSNDDTAELQACINDATNNLPATVYIPPGDYRISTDIVVPSSSDFQIPYITGVNTSTDTITWSAEHKKKNGDPVMLQGFALGGVTNGALYFANCPSATTMKLYDTRANAIAGGAGGLVDITSGVTTTGSITSGTASLAVAAELTAEKGTMVIVSGINNSNGGYYIIDGLGTGTFTLNANANNTVSGATVTYVTNMDWRYYDSGLKIIFAPGAKFKKTSTFSGNSLLYIALGSGVEIRGGTFEGNTTALNSGINAGDDLLRIISSHRILVENCVFRHAGDGALRVSTSTRDPQAARPNSATEGGVNSGEIVIRNNYFYNVHQFSSTTNDFVHGGAQNLFFYGNVMDNLRGSIKVANRVPGGRNMYMWGNTFKSSLDKGFEIDSMENIFIWGNTFRNITNSAICILSNNGPANSGFGTGIVGLNYDTAHIFHNTFEGCAATGGIIRFQPDIYSDGTLIDYDHVDISDNTFRSVSGTSVIGILLINGSYKQLTMNRNKFASFNGITAIKATLRGSVTSGFKNTIQCNYNQIDMNNTGASGSHIWIERTAGTEKLRGIQIVGNQLTGSCTQAIVAGDWTKAKISGNYMDLAAGNFFLRNSGSFNELTVTNNECETAGTFGFAPSSCDGLYVHGNQFRTASGTALRLGNTNQNVWEFNNLVSGGSKDVAQVPVNSKGLGKTGRREDGTAAPTTGTWRIGDIVDLTNTAAGATPGKYCVTAGTMGTITTTTATTTNGSADIEVSTVSGIAVGCYIAVAGVTGTKKVLSIVGTTVTVDSTCDADTSGAAVSYVAATFKDLASIAA